MRGSFLPMVSSFFSIHATADPAAVLKFIFCLLKKAFPHFPGDAALDGMFAELAEKYLDPDSRGLFASGESALSWDDEALWTPLCQEPEDLRLDLLDLLTNLLKTSGASPETTEKHLAEAAA